MICLCGQGMSVSKFDAQVYLETAHCTYCQRSWSNSTRPIVSSTEDTPKSSQTKPNIPLGKPHPRARRQRT